MNNIQIANETIKITQEKKYKLPDTDIEIILPNADYSEVKVYSVKEPQQVLTEEIRDYKRRDEICKIIVTNEDSFKAAKRYEKTLVMNFANAHNPGGGFRLGANAQEEALCRCSTLYSSLTSENASEMYKYNNTHISLVESDYMLLSPNVCVFRDEKCNLVKDYFMTSVITLPAPNRRGAALFASKKTINETITRRIRIMMKIAMINGYDNLILGAWGCGAFGNNPKEVSECFRQVIVEEELGKCFDEICFAVYGSETGKNITAFRETFKI